mmetsp:Transcript_24862/g.64903  ORF Transcript_24862/g.64903 Transcript_24862/m.64903 type:complete len:207 (+) Transcript_24862:556-1176(+)
MDQAAREQGGLSGACARGEWARGHCRLGRLRVELLLEGRDEPQGLRQGSRHQPRGGPLRLRGGLLPALLAHQELVGVPLGREGQPPARADEGGGESLRLGPEAADGLRVRRGAEGGVGLRHLRDPLRHRDPPLPARGRRRRQPRAAPRPAPLAEVGAARPPAPRLAFVGWLPCARDGRELPLRDARGPCERRSIICYFLPHSRHIF